MDTSNGNESFNELIDYAQQDNWAVALERLLRLPVDKGSYFSSWLLQLSRRMDRT